MLEHYDFQGKVAVVMLYLLRDNTPAYLNRNRYLSVMFIHTFNVGRISDIKI